ncbi:probable LRR receptor-like serine/threonine-protein kinase RFK1 isoform X2 [Eutrema salsugineum]|uniref:probable LRR receptor-like serine/threonine-protein kinase RFK1 isoform X2 n=1 Tax=Eutrema salsugineum TaxID=72664 RepID=UPI000CED38A5|nr:probable LRR receptor-like serine/threonine-protein kinase RFK1 isoform X2 [Eutrema salsugineum]
MFAEKKKKKKDVHVFAFSVFAIICFKFHSINAINLPQDEVDALQQIATTLGSRYWIFDPKACKVEKVGLTETPSPTAKQEVECECSPKDENDCHVVKIAFKDHNLPGTLPPQIIKLRYLREIDLAYNYLNGSIPLEWASTNLTFISLLVNRLSGEIPKELANITSLTYLDLESNAFSGTIPQELGNLVNLQTLLLSSNKLTGNLPASLSKLQDMTDLINDLQLSGTIPSYIQNWTDLKRLEMIASGLTGPIPSAISVLNNLSNLRISDIGGPVQPFPSLKNSTGFSKIILKNCNLSGKIPTYLSDLQNLETLDLSFNKLVGGIPTFAQAEKLRFIILAGNMLEEEPPDELLRDGITLDLSYNNLKWQSPESRSCRPNMNLNLNLFQSTSTKKSSKFLPCINDFKCPRYSSCLHVNCGGSDLTVKEKKSKILYEGDGEAEGGAAKYFLKPNNAYWGFSSTGDYMDDNNFQNTRFSVFVPSSNLSELYKTARMAPVSLTYFHACLENGKYTVNLDFAELRFTNDETYSRLGRRVFDIYIQEKLVAKDFNIMDEAKGAQKPITKSFMVNVTNHFLAIRLGWAGKGTTRIPNRGVYGPLISAISILSDSKPCTPPASGLSLGAYIAIGVGAPFLIISILGLLWFCGCLPRCWQRRKDPYEEELPSGTFTLRQIKFATDDFNPNNKIGEGGFGPVFKGVLSDGRVVAVKQLSSKSRQGNREFLNEIGAISCLQHQNLVKLHGFCVERAQLLLVYEYMENNSLAQALFSPKHKQIPMDWPTRFKICCGIAKGLAFLHEESPLKFVHRDIKATNILLDKDLNPKISDFGLARLDEAENTHISTKVAGTIGYMAPEYALWGYLTFKADVYSFGVLVLEIVAGITNSNFMAAGDSVCLLEFASQCEESGHLLQVVDERLRPEVNKEEAEAVIKVALVCTSASPTDRPIMSEVVAMLEGLYPVPEPTPGSSRKSGDIRFKAFKDLRMGMENNSKTQYSVNSYPPPSSSTHEVGQERKKE